MAHGFLYAGDFGGSPVWGEPAGPNALFRVSALILIAAIAATLLLRSRMGGREADAIHPFTYSLFTIHYSPILPSLPCCSTSSECGRQKAAAPRFPQALEQYLNGKPATFIAEVTGSPEYIRSTVAMIPA
ncbi:MAG: hypothetical protein ACLQBD_29475 [Syntrophobacteraceae bacterium]